MKESQVNNNMTHSVYGTVLDECTIITDMSFCEITT